MKYYRIDLLGDTDSGWCLLDNLPNIGRVFYKPAEGQRVGAAYPEDVRITMSDEFRGTRIPSLIGNTNSYLIVDKPVKEVIEQYCEGVDIEYLPFTLYNHKNRVASKTHFMINPIGTFDCLDLDESEIERLDSPSDPDHGAVVGIDRYVLDPQKLQAAPALFRIPEEPDTYVINGALADAFAKRGFTNVVLDELEQSAARQTARKRG
jgi:hypothetical protein